ncbi:MAG: ABC transporter ATP-binding protein [Alphaproteobacteria bacterium]|jgi:ATP-binding cassette, subfamily B, bacterial MsbA|nr:ABC transporter ATP-binding protein [Alphaproteobacteria bacterium]MBT5389512.1 ABC transporter ATP-binding protein [Alphaproteobacteria bacterium]MBT5654286.1 ABC transporter ATP-binding protein [Alphaproteobacteria bacterium]
MASLLATINASSYAICKRIAKHYIRKHRTRIFFAFLFMAIAAAGTAAWAKLLEPIINDIFLKKDETMLYPVALTILLVFAGRGAAMYGESICMSFLGNRLIADLQRDLFASLLKNDLAFFQNHPSGELMSRCVNDVGIMRQLVFFILNAVGKYFITIIFLIGIMFYQDWLLASVAFLVFPTTIYPIVRIGKRVRKNTNKTQIEVASLMTLLSQVFQGARLVKAYGMETYEKSRLSDLAESIFKFSYKQTRIRSIASPIMETIGGLAIVTVIIYGGIQVINGARTPGAIFSFITALLLAYDPIKRLATLNANLQEGLAAAVRVFEVMDVEPTIKSLPQAKTLSAPKGYIEFKNVSFSYNKGHEKALDNISLQIPAGKTIALVGPSGGGKSTLLNLIPRFYDVQQGEISIDGMPVNKATLSSLRGNIALVSQEIMLFDDTVKANIGYGKVDATDDEIVSAAKSAAAHDFIESLPQGYDTFVGEQGVKLSGGQRQRLAIARALLKDAPILLLDEATSALDTESERKVQKALETLQKGRTCLIIAHRLSTIVDADVICVLKDGQIVELGRHKELLKQEGVYATLCEMQFSQNGIGTEESDLTGTYV